MKISILDEADADLLQVYSCLVERNPAAADSVAREIDQKFENLSRFPFLDRERSSLVPGIRSITADMYVIFYAVARDHITIVPVPDGRRDIDAEFQR